MAKVEIYKLKKTAPPEVREYSVFDYMRSGVTPNPLHYVREWAGEMYGTLPLTIPGRLMLEPPQGYHGGNIKNGDIAVINGTPYFMDHDSGAKFVEIAFDSATVRDAIHVQYGWHVDVKGAEAISDVISYICDDIGIPVGYLGEPMNTEIFIGRRPFLPGSSVGDHLRFLHPDFMKGEEAQAFTSLLSELTESEHWPEIFDYLREHYPAGQQDLEMASIKFAPELLLPKELRSLSKVIPAGADKSELDYLAAKVRGMDEERRNIFDAVVEAGWHCGSVGEIINLTENLDCFELQSTFVGTEYGEYRLERDWEECVEVIDRLEKSDDPAERALVKYITLLGRCADADTYGFHAAKEEDGVFTPWGIITEERDLQEIYRGTQDIPAEYRVSEPPPAVVKNELIMVGSTDLSALLLEMHALGGDYMKDAKRNLQTLTGNGTEYFVMIKNHMLTVTPAETLFHSDTAEHEAWMLTDITQNVKTFVMSVTDRRDGLAIGNIYEADLWFLQDCIRENSFFFTHFDAEMKDGTKRLISGEEWDAMVYERDTVIKKTKYYDPEAESRLSVYLDTFRWAIEENRRAVPTGIFLQQINEQYIAQSHAPQPGWFRVAPEAARDFVAQDAANIFKAYPEPLARLMPIDATKASLWAGGRCEFVVRHNECEKLERWARRASGEMLRQAERGEHKKFRDAEI